MNLQLPDALADALGRVVADVHKEWRRDLDRIGAESRAVIAEFRLDAVGFKAELKELAASEELRVSEAIAKIRDGEKGEPGVDGAPGRDGADGAPGVDGLPGRDGVDGKSVDADEVAALVDASVNKAVAVIPVPKDGRDGTNGIDGKDADPELIENAVMQAVGKAMKAVPVQKGDTGEPGLKGADGAPGRDGAGVAGAVIARDGGLVLTLSDGTTREIGSIVGRDGVDADLKELEVLKASVAALNSKLAEVEGARSWSDDEFQRRVEASLEQPLQSDEMMRDVVVGVMREAPQPTVNVTVPVHMPRRGKEVMTVEYDANGRIKRSVKEEVD